MILLELFLAFMRIGVVSFGGGYGMIALVRETVVNNGWMTDQAFLEFLAVAESTPGPIAINMATYIGSRRGGILGSAVATLGVILPSLIIILVITIAARHFMQRAGVKAFLGGVRPCVVALILGTAVTLGIKALSLSDLFEKGQAPDIRAAAILLIVAAADGISRRFRKKKISPIILILFSACLGLVFWGFC